MSYALDTEAAKQADTGSGRITETGKYVGQFTVAKQVLSKKNTEGIEFSFKSSAGQTADYLTVWTLDKDGKEIFGYKQLMAMMICFNVRKITPIPGEVDVWDKGSSKTIKQKAEVFKELMDKPIGLLLQFEEYEKLDGSLGEKAAFAGFFEPSSEMVATEILENASQPKILEKLISQLVPIKKLKVHALAQGYQGSKSMPDKFDDHDINF